MLKIRQLVLPAFILLFVLGGLISAESTQEKASCEKTNELTQKLKTCPYKIMYESYRDNNWELFTMNADGSNPVNITKTPDISEIYPHVSPDGSKVVFVSDEGKGIFTHRSVYYMNIDGTERVKVADNARQPCWQPDGMVIAYMKGPAGQGEAKYYPNKGLYFYDLATGKRSRHPNDTLENFVNLCYSPDGKWIMCTVVGALGYGQSILAIQVDGNEVVNLIHQARAVTKTIMGCRPDVSPKGDKITWAVEDDNKMMWIETADLIYAPVTEGGIPMPKAVNYRHMVSSPLPDNELYHADWAPDNRLIAFSKGPVGGKMEIARYVPGQQAPGWNICVVDSSNPGSYVEITTDGLSDKEPDWFVPQADTTNISLQNTPCCLMTGN